LILGNKDDITKSQSHGAGAYCGSHLAAQLVIYLYT